MNLTLATNTLGCCQNCDSSCIMVALWLQLTKFTTTCEIALSSVSSHCSLQMQTCQTWLCATVLTRIVKTTILVALWFTKLTITYEMVFNSRSFFTGHNLPVLCMCLTTSLNSNCDGPASTCNHPSSHGENWPSLSWYRERTVVKLSCPWSHSASDSSLSESPADSSLSELSESDS